MQIVIDIDKETYKHIMADSDVYVLDEVLVENAIYNGTPFKECEHWIQLKETITEIRDNNQYEDNGATEICKFLLNYMGVLENADSN